MLDQYKHLINNVKGIYHLDDNTLYFDLNQLSPQYKQMLISLCQLYKNNLTLEKSTVNADWVKSEDKNKVFDILKYKA